MDASERGVLLHRLAELIERDREYLAVSQKSFLLSTVTPQGFLGASHLYFLGKGKP